MPHFIELTAALWKVSTKGKFSWEAEQDWAFQRTKEAIINCTTTHGFFDVNDGTTLYTDASPHALGAVLVQTNKKGENRIISFASKALTETEKKYAQTQREALAIVWATEHFYYYLLGQRFTIKTDAQGVKFIFERGGEAPKRVMRRAEGWAMRLDAFDFKIEFVEGESNIADPSSRLYEGEAKEYVESEAPCEILEVRVTEMTPLEFGDLCMPPLEVEIHTRADETMQQVRQALETGEWGENLSEYKQIRDELFYTNGILTRAGQAVLPESLRNKALMLAHKGHPGSTKMKSILKDRVWWPGMSTITERWVESCKTCVLTGRKEAPVPMQRTKLPETPWEFLAVDFCGPYAMFGGVTILGVIDGYSRYIAAGPVSSTDFRSTAVFLTDLFDKFGYPKRIKSDNGSPFFSKEFEQYCRNRGIATAKSWPLHPQQNGMAERSMATIGKAMKAASVEDMDFRRALKEGILAHNSSQHRTTGQIPSDVLFGRRLRRALPLLKSSTVNIDHDGLRERDWEEKLKSKEREDLKRGARESRIGVGDTVVLRRDNARKGETNYDPRELTVVARREGDLTMQASDGSTVRRNIVLVKKLRNSGRPSTEPVNTPASTPTESHQRRPERAKKVPARYLNAVKGQDSDESGEATMMY